METMIQPKITGYRQLSEAEIALMNEGKALARGVNATFTDPIGNVHRVHKACLKTLNAQRPVTAQPMHEAIGLGTYSSRKEDRP